MSVEFEINKKD